MSLSIHDRWMLRQLAHEHDEQPAREGDLRVWWIPQIGCGAMFIRRVRDLAEAAAISDALSAYDAFQLIHRIKPDYANAGGISVYEEGEWSDWCDPETGDDFNAWRRAQRGDGGEKDGKA